MAGGECKKICDVCGGTGQVSYFKGVSRFLLSTEECDVCAGTGCQWQDDGREEEAGSPESSRQSGRKKKKG